MAKKGNIEDNREMKEKIDISLLQQARIMQQNDELIRLFRDSHSMPPPPEKVYTPEETKDILRISARTLLTLKQTGKIAFCNINRNIFYLQSHIDEFLRNNSHRAIQQPSKRKTTI